MNLPRDLLLTWVCIHSKRMLISSAVYLTGTYINCVRLSVYPKRPSSSARCCSISAATGDNGACVSKYFLVLCSPVVSYTEVHNCQGGFHFQTHLAAYSPGCEATEESSAMGMLFRV